MISRATALSLIVAIVVAALPAASREVPGPIVVTVLSTYDGDTFRARAHLSTGQNATFSVRLRGVDTPEIGRNARCADEERRGLEARDYLDRLLRITPVELTALGPDKYKGRIDARVHAGGVDVAAALIAAGLGRPYGRGRRQSWC